eukprot:g9052.t1
MTVQMTFPRIARYFSSPLVRRRLQFYPFSNSFSTKTFLANCLNQDSPSQTPSYKALFVDAAGTLVYPAQSVPVIYRRFGQKYGVKLTEDEILFRYREAFAHPPLHDQWASTSLRYVGDGKEFWKHIISHSTGCNSDDLVDELYKYYEQKEAWAVESGAYEAFLRLKKFGVKILVVSNFDTRLRPLLETLGFHGIFDDVIVSAEVGAEKPNPTIFIKALESAQCHPAETVHVGDDRRNDLWGARDAGIEAWLWRSDVNSFREIADRILCDSKIKGDQDNPGNTISLNL